MEEKRKTVDSIVKWVGDIANLVANHGAWKLLSSTMVLCMCIFMVTITLNPGIILNKIDEYTERMAENKKEWRDKNDPIIRADMNNTMYHLGAARVSVLEFHNGKSNPAGLGFYYVDMTYEVCNDGFLNVANQYVNVNLSLLNIPTILYRDGYWYGTTDELRKTDPMLASMMEQNGTKWIALLLLEGSAELGILEVSFSEIPDKDALPMIGRDIRKLGAQIASKLDYKANR